ncbi:hypothetical protein BDW22DRAFT_1432753 [Trametopsis cervina]|nr:hypothetical protein BDW22DRAFT_1432753 [Trametopsis cervina]
MADNNSKCMLSDQEIFMGSGSTGREVNESGRGRRRLAREVHARAQYGDARTLVNHIEKEEGARARVNENVHARAQYGDVHARTQGGRDEGARARVNDKVHARAQYAGVRARAQGAGGAGGRASSNDILHARAQYADVRARAQGGGVGAMAGGGEVEGVRARAHDEDNEQGGVGVWQRTRVVGRWLTKVWAGALGERREVGDRARGEGRA